jgi:hypothetical protein
MEQCMLKRVIMPLSQMLLASTEQRHKMTLRVHIGTIFAFLIFASVPVDANELLLRCNWGVIKAGVRVDVDNSIVTLVFDYGDTERARANITNNHIGFHNGVWTIRINRITGSVVAVHDFLNNFNLNGRCDKADGF